MSGKSSREERRQERLQREEAAGAQARRRRLLQLGAAIAFVAIVVAAVLIVISVNQGGGGGTSIQGASSVRSELSGIPQSGLILGDPKAKVTLMEFGDLQCPVCKQFAEEILPEVISSKVRSGEARLEFRNFRIISQQSVPAGAAAIAAGKEGRGWDFIELFYRNQRKEGSGYVTDEFLTEVAKKAGVVNIAKWNADRKSKEVLGEVHRTTAEAEGLGFEGTPSFAVKGPSTAGLRTLGTPGSSTELISAIEEAG